MTTCAANKPLVFGPDPATFKVCSFLVNVLSNMYDQWVTSGKPLPELFKWQPVYSCLVPSVFKVTDFSFFGSLIWSKYTWGVVPHHEPFGSLVKSNLDNKVYLVFRGSKSIADFLVDTEAGFESYTPPTPNPPSGINVEQGWKKVYDGLLPTLRAQLQQIATGQVLTIAGHSLGSTLATLAVPEAVNQKFQVWNYNSASPMVGDDAFRSYYESLELVGRNPGVLKGTFRLVNDADTVPDFPSPAKHPGYVHVGTEVSFNAEYGEMGKPDPEKNHSVCCTYAYALHHPDQPCNPKFDDCNIPIN